MKVSLTLYILAGNLPKCAPGDLSEAAVSSDVKRDLNSLSRN